ncbi:MAG: hypothetical protein D6B27_04105 [Gammaproteobacteria bacterium]|nr:MAG: hypothetical protein D6B27_04105 [Gammaproteobacteria bacterium]
MKLKTILLSGILLFIQYSNAYEPMTEERRLKYIMAVLPDFVSSANYCALIQYTSVEIAPHEIDYEEKQIYHAKVLETFRGPKYKNITFTTSTEVGDGTGINTTPVVITLCHNKEGLWGLGIGSEYPAIKEVIDATKKIVEKTKDQKNFEYCK